VTWGGAAAFVVLLIGGLWAWSTHTFGDVKQDVREIRHAVTELAKVDGTLRQSFDSEAKHFLKTIGETNATVARNEQGIKNLEAGLGDLKKEVANFRSEVKSELIDVNKILREINTKIAYVPGSTVDPKAAMVRGVPQDFVKVRDWGHFRDYLEARGVKLVPSDIWVTDPASTCGNTPRNSPSATICGSNPKLCFPAWSRPFHGRV